MTDGLSDAIRKSWRSGVRKRLALLCLLFLIIFGAVQLGILLGGLAKSYYLEGGHHYRLGGYNPRGIPKSIMPGPPRTAQLDFRLDESNSLRMQPSSYPGDEERYCDIADNFYTSDFIKRFSYAGTDTDSPQVLIQIKEAGPSLEGRLEARNLKPNFAYQIKLAGNFKKDRQSFERIGS